MTLIDVRTLFIVYVLTSALCAFVMALLWLQNRKRFPEISLWLIDFVLQFIGLLLVTLRGIVPDFASMVLSNTFIIGGTVILYIGLERFVEKRSRKWHNYVMLIVFTLVHAYLTFIYPSLALRNVNLSFGLLYISVQVSWLMLRRVKPDMRPATRATGIVFAVFCLVSLGRIVANLVRQQSNNELFKSGLFDAIIIMIYQILFIALTFALFLIVNRRLSATLENELVERKHAEEKERLLLDSTAEAIYGIDLQGNCTFANPSCARMLGYTTTEELLGKNMHNLIHHSYPDGSPMPVEICRIYKAFRVGEGFHVDDEVLWKKDGSSFPVEYWSYPQKVNEDVSGAVVTFIDITKRKLAEEKVLHMATHDLLTDLPTLRLAEDRLSMAMGLASRHKEMVAVMFIDLDNFKTVNDILGHNAGDYLLKQVAGRLLSCVRKTDTVARVGGDEFLLIASELHSSNDAVQMAEEVIRLVAQPVTIDGRSAVTSASIGIAFYPDHGENIDQLIKLADEAMYRIKNGGKNGFGFANAAIK
jgi:diguanylate cyclase (GGDEF)-like protein/PAS domain S-box-containing protein